MNIVFLRCLVIIVVAVLVDEEKFMMNDSVFCVVAVVKIADVEG